MLPAPRLRQPELALAFGEAGAVPGGIFVDAGGATDALGVVWMSSVLRANRTATGVAEGVDARPHPMTNRDAVVEDEAFALPAALRGRDFLEVFQDAAPEVQHLRDALPE